MEEQVSEVEGKVIITNNNLLFHFGGHNNDLLILKQWFRTVQVYCIKSDSVLQGAGGRGESYFPYILLNEIQTMFSQLAKRSVRVLPADLCTDHAYYVKIHRSTSKAEKRLRIR